MDLIKVGGTVLYKETAQEIDALEQAYHYCHDRPSVVYGLVAAAGKIDIPDGPGYNGTLDLKIRFLTPFLRKVYQSPWMGLIHAEVISQLVEAGFVNLFYWGEDPPGPFLVEFLGQHPAFQGIQSKVREFLAKLVRGVFSKEAGLENVARALLRYGMYDPLRREFVWKKVYEAIPALFETVVEQLGHVRQEGNPEGPTEEVRRVWAMPLVRGGWSARYHVALILRLVGSDARVLCLLLDLSQAYINEYGKPYPLEELRAT